MFETQWLLALLGGALVGSAALLLLLVNGRIAGISGILTGALQSRTPWRWVFLLGLGVGAWLAFTLGWAALPDFAALPAWPWVALAGLLVGIGTRFANGCTSGHGICGMGRLSPRSIVATLTFMASGIVTVFVTHHLL
ncbi:YeeE/YedE family protein [Aeromonas simiae]|uniref:YeeE/YedE family protein n=1 Tax=Aeromonas simiae TaxID=218936 RepID=A0A5J6WV90_9GAMM|nr:YeeE/YedE thiosulfate transporter family protein [Aeromonas simiae]MDO2949783.1 YeeE/YedE family protein [Aeromonas simiae]MDO2951014.1 YeeE/YedE family protein [Aeromonas simiae]MDO2957129.1 YeeE/YedE family protein [Aeromonas simiae]QFI54121.1 YeeE/YedE family protein [Aeromonas simiae]